MHLLIGQIVYTSLDNIGFRSLASSQVPQKIQQAFIQQVAAKYWDIYNPPPSGYQAIFLHQLTPEHTLFGWLYSEDSNDDLDRTVPYFHCYYLAEPLRDFHLENIFTCLEKGPVSLIDRDYPPDTLEPIVIQTPWTFNNKFWSYQSSHPGVEIPIDVRDRSYVALHQGELLDIFIPIAAETESNLKSPNSLEHLVEILEMKAVVLDQAPTAIAPVAITPYQGHKENLQRYEQAFMEALTQNHFKGDRTGNLKRLQHSLRLTNQDISPIEARIQRQIQVRPTPENYPRAISRENLISAQVIKETVAGD
jgi:phosphate transport system substrate-binding protein